MAAVTADQIRKERSLHTKEYATAAVFTGQTVYIGTLLCFPPGSARVRNGAATANYICAGICEELINDSGSPLSAITGNTAGTVRVKYSYGHECSFVLITAARTYTNINKTALIKTNNELEGTAVGTAAVRIPVGTIVETDAAALATVWVAIRRFGTGNATG
jgi:hypothetical protein